VPPFRWFKGTRSRRRRSAQPANAVLNSSARVRNETKSQPTLTLALGGQFLPFNLYSCVEQTRDQHSFGFWIGGEATMAPSASLSQRARRYCMAIAPLRSRFAETSSSRRVLGSPFWYRVGPWPVLLQNLAELAQAVQTGPRERELATDG